MVGQGGKKSFSRPSRWPLREKILFPFFLILILLGGAATIGCGLLISDTLSRQGDERLRDFQKFIRRELTRQENLLVTYACLLRNSRDLHRYLPRMPTGEDLSRLLPDATVTGRLYPADGELDGPLPPLVAQVRQNGKPASGLIGTGFAVPAMAVAVPLDDRDRKPPILLLSTPLDEEFLRLLPVPLKGRVLLLTDQGVPLAASGKGENPPPLTDAERTRLVQKENLTRTFRSPTPRQLLYFPAHPAGDRLLLVAIELPMTDPEELIATITFRSALSIFCALLLGGYIYYRLVRQIMAPTKELLAATAAVGEGNLGHRIAIHSRDEFGQLAISFNRMMSQLATLYEESIRQEKRLAQAGEELRHKNVLEEKNRQIERANRELAANLRDLSALFQLNRAMISTLDLDRLFTRILEVLQEVLGCDELVLLIYQPEDGQLTVRKSLGGGKRLLPEVSFRLDEGVTGLAASSRQLRYVPDLACDPCSLNYKKGTPSRGSMISAPMVVKNRLVGVLNLHKEEVNGFSDTDVKLVQAVANQAAMAIENAQLYEQTRSLSITDELTGLVNRRRFLEVLRTELIHVERFGGRFGLVMVDIDHFKAFNDHHGHAGGDAVLKQVATLLLANIREVDVAARLGGEEFVLLLPQTDREGAWSVAEKLRRAVIETAFPGARESQPGGCVTLSLGVAVCPEDGQELQDLLDKADRALYRAKEKGRNRIELWSRGRVTSPLRSAATAGPDL